MRNDVLAALLAAGAGDDELPAPAAGGFFDGAASALSLAHGARLSAGYVQAVCQQSPALQQLDLSGCFHVSDACLAACLAACPSLERLRLVGCRKLTDAAVDALLAHGRKLRRLDVSGCFNLSAPALQALLARHPSSARCGGPGFVELGLSGVEGGAQLVAAAAGAGGAALRSAALGYSVANDKTLAAFVRACPGLRRVAMHWCGGAGEHVLAALGQLRQLRWLDLSGSAGVPTYTIGELVRARASAGAALGVLDDSDDSDVELDAAAGGGLRALRLAHVDVPADLRQALADGYPAVRVAYS